VRLEHKERLVLLDLKELKGQLEHKELQEQVEVRVLQVLQVFQEPQVQAELVGQVVHQE
jgi:hypothetical protein